MVSFSNCLHADWLVWQKVILHVGVTVNTFMVCVTIHKLLCIAQLEQAQAQIQLDKERANHLEGMFI